MDSFLSDRHQRVIFNGQCFNWSHIKAGFSQDTFLGPLLFLVYINVLPEGLTISAKLFEDDHFFPWFITSQHNFTDDDSKDRLFRISGFYLFAYC